MICTYAPVCIIMVYIKTRTVDLLKVNKLHTKYRSLQRSTTGVQLPIHAPSLFKFYKLNGVRVIFKCALFK